jgi:vacuolar-type H+-ATPase subunit E/Vma4
VTEEETKAVTQEIVQEAIAEQAKRCGDRFAKTNEELLAIHSALQSINNQLANGFTRELIQKCLDAALDSKKVRDNLTIATSQRRWGVIDKLVDHALKAIGVGGIVWLLVEFLINRAR